MIHTVGFKLLQHHPIFLLQKKKKKPNLNMLGNVTCFPRCKQSLSKEKNKKNNHELQFIRDDMGAWDQLYVYNIDTNDTPIMGREE